MSRRSTALNAVRNLLSKSEKFKVAKTKREATTTSTTVYPYIASVQPFLHTEDIETASDTYDIVVEINAVLSRSDTGEDWADEMLEEVRYRLSNKMATVVYSDECMNIDSIRFVGAYGYYDDSDNAVTTSATFSVIVSNDSGVGYV
jgi:hypothetical protein